MIDINKFEEKANEIINQEIDYHKIGKFHKDCDDSCKYHCTENNTQIAECVKENYELKNLKNK